MRDFGKGRKVETERDFEEFLGWLTNYGVAEERKDLYEKKAKKKYSPETLSEMKSRMGAEKYLTEAKAEVIGEISKDFVQGLLEKANECAREIESEESTDKAARLLRDEISRAKKLLARFQSACAKEIFSIQMIGAGLTEKASNKMLDILSEKWAKEPMNALAEAMRASAEQTVEEGSSCFKRYLESGERRAQMTTKNESGGGSMSKSEREGLGKFAPLLDFMENSLLPAEKAEMMAKMMGYVRSGWAAVDMAGIETKEEMRRHSPWTDHDAVEGWRGVLKRIEEKGGRLDDAERSEALNAFARRMAEISFDVKVSKPNEKKKSAKASEIESFEKQEGRVKGWEDLIEKAATKMVDVVLVGPKSKEQDKRKVVAACATSMVSMLRQGTQPARYFYALSKELKSGSNDPFEVLKGSELDFYMLAPCLVNFQEDVRNGKAAGKALMSRIENGLNVKGSEWMAERDKAKNAINVVPMMRTMCSTEGFETPAEVFKSSLALAGASSERWNAARERVSREPKENQNEASLRELAKMESEVLDLLLLSGSKLVLRPDETALDKEGIEKYVARSVLSAVERTTNWVDDFTREGRDLSPETKEALAEMGMKLNAFQEELLSYAGDSKGRQLLIWQSMAKELTDLASTKTAAAGKKM